MFVNYRTGDGDWAAALVSRELSTRFGADQVFYASQSIRLGEEFPQEILARLQRCEVLLAMIGPRWITAVDREGVRRLDKPDDWVRREINEAFCLGIRVIPVLLDGIGPLRETDLPDCLAPVARCQYLRMHHRSGDLDLTRLVDELLNVAPSLATPTGAALPTRHRTTERVHLPDPGVPHPPARRPRGADGELRSMVTELRQALADSSGQIAVHDLVHVTATQALDALGDARYPAITRHMEDSDLPAALEERLTSYERDMAPLLRLVAVGVCSGAREHDDLWIAIANRVLNRRDTPPPSDAQEARVAAEAYPALLLVYTVGVAGMAAAREDLVYRLLCQTTTSGTNGRPVPVIRALALRHVIDPRNGAALPKWRGASPGQALSAHLRDVLDPVFFNVLHDREFELSFEDYEYVRSLLELHEGPFSSLGTFAEQLAKGSTAVHQRNVVRLAPNSALLQHGAFGGNSDRVAEVWCELRHSVRARYP
ncbi:toll/interleukin-1 receptor domain-containing protein [Actinosynnema sp. ALI-1.44]|uniref:toll/interleukin-1 receptor domain-containing protein n=1 Tax=Actinosynnema sp. ALI-1.44 TaxID=1933779 RepID=UPI00143D92BB|nr:toll/interleukin-1 receptor domain-containing protein [Actinosynnema sp. ALI-1.44]